MRPVDYGRSFSRQLNAVYCACRGYESRPQVMSITASVDISMPQIVYSLRCGATSFKVLVNWLHTTGTDQLLTRIDKRAAHRPVIYSETVEPALNRRFLQCLDIPNGRRSSDKRAPLTPGAVSSLPSWRAKSRSPRELDCLTPNPTVVFGSPFSALGPRTCRVTTLSGPLSALP